MTPTMSAMEQAKEAYRAGKAAALSGTAMTFKHVNPLVDTAFRKGYRIGQQLREFEQKKGKV